MSIFPRMSAEPPLRRYLHILCIAGLTLAYLVVVTLYPQNSDQVSVWLTGLLVCLYGALCVIDLDTALGFLILFLPLSNKIIPGLSFAVTNLLVLLLALVVWLRTVLGGKIFRLESGTGWILLWMVVVLISSAASMDPGLSIKSWTRMAVGVVVLMIVRDHIRTRLQFDRLILWLIVSGLFLACNGLAESVTRFARIPWNVDGRFNNWIRITGIVNQSSLLAWWLVPLVPLGIATIRLPGNFPRRILRGLATAAIVGAILLTFSRGGWVALTVVLIAAPVGRKIKMVGLLGLIVLVLISAPLSSITARRASVEFRMGQYRSAPGLTAHHPGLGYGLGSYKYMDHYEPDLFPPKFNGKSSHSLYITLAVETGLISTAIFVVLLIRIGWGLRRALRSSTAASQADRIWIVSLAAAFVGMLTLQCFCSSLQLVMYWLWLALFLAAPAVLTSDPSARTSPA